MRYLSIIILLVTLLSCQNDKKIERGMYFWKSEFSISQEQQTFLNKIETEVLYVHFFDVVMSIEGAVPVAEINNFERIDIPIVPVVYISTDVFTQLDSSSISSLSEKVYSKIIAIYGSEEYEEIQIDCDWTPSIREKYFYFLECFKSQMFKDARLSVTVRLYQYKYPDISGIPPVDKGLLMYYNMGDLTDYKEKNSILNNEIGDQYLLDKEYPLPVDVALPNFEWTLLFREGEFVQICPQFSENQLKNSSLFISEKENHFIFTKDTVIDETYFRYGDELRYEYCSEEQLVKAAELINDKVGLSGSRVLIYHLQEKTIHDYEKLDAVYSVFE